jgi:hypothetical protein
MATAAGGGGAGRSQPTRPAAAGTQARPTPGRYAGARLRGHTGARLRVDAAGRIAFALGIGAAQGIEDVRHALAS